MSNPQALAVLEDTWKNFSFRMLTQDDVPEIEHHMKHNFWATEPISVISGITEENAGNLNFSELYIELTAQNLTFGAFDMTNGHLAAIRAICRHKRGQDDTWAFKNSSDEIKVVLGFLEKAGAGLDICDMYQVEEYAHLRFACVDKKYRNLGLATEMYRRTIPFLKAEGFKVAESNFTGPYSRAASVRFGFQELQRRYFRTMQDLNGKYLKPEATDDEYATVKALRL